MKSQRRAVQGGALAGCVTSWHCPASPAVAPTIPGAHCRQSLADALRRAADGDEIQGMATLVVRDGDVLIDSIEFGGARVPDGNGAGIRFERGLHQMSALRGRGVDPGQAHGQAHGVDLRPRSAFTLPAGTRRVAMADRWSPGAYQD